MVDYESVYPRSQKATYASGDIVDFNLSFIGKSLVLNQISISGTLSVQNGGAVVDPADNLFYDSAIGIHGFFNNWNISTAKQGVVQSMATYPRYVKMVNTATRAAPTQMSSARCGNDLIVPLDAHTPVMMQNDLSFSFNPMICLNMASGTPLLSYSTSGDVTISLRLCQVAECLFNLGVGPTDVTYSISDLRLSYATSAAAAKGPVLLNNIVELKTIVSSGNSMISCKIPTSILSVVASFMRTSEEASISYKNTRLEMLDGLQKVYFQFNNSTSEYVSYGLESLEDITENYLDAFNSASGKNDFTLQQINNDDRSGIGLGFGDAVSLAGESIGLNIISSVAANPYYAYLYFLSPIALGAGK